MAFINDNAFDQGLNYITTNGTRMDICSAEPTTYAEATSTLTLGNKSTGLNTGSPTNGAVDGRRVIVPTFSDGNITATGTAAFWALTDNSSILVATGSLASSQVVTSGGTFGLTDTSITYRDAT